MAPKLKSPSPSTIQVRKALSTIPKTPEDLIKETGLPCNAVSVALRTICSSTEDVIRTKVGRTYFYCLVDNSKVANLEGEEEVCNNHPSEDQCPDSQHHVETRLVVGQFPGRYWSSQGLD